MGYLDLDKRHRCRFHGAGCCVQISRNRSVDWDYGHGGRIDGFDLWRLTKFLRPRRKLQRVLALDRLQEAFERASKDGAISPLRRAEHDRLFYIVTAQAPNDSLQRSC